MMKTVRAPLQTKNNHFVLLLPALALLFLLSISATAQSTDAEYPTLIRSNEISGTIAPRDIGDPRLTRYFYSFTGTPGDLIVTVESRNLEGDVDVFTAGTLRPLGKISMYAGVSTSGGTKTIYLRTRESLILRIEARTPNDNEGSFRIRFDGTFEPISRDIPDTEPVVPTVSSASKGRRVTATGARIEEPEPQPTVAETKPETTTPAPVTPTTETPAETTAPTTEAAKSQPPKAVTTRRRPGTARTTRTRPSTTRRRTTPAPKETAPAPTETASTTNAKPAEPAAAGPRLIIETKDGMRIEHYMTTVRRVMVDGNAITVIMKNGKVESQPMSNVQRMAIEP
ncbi:MAG TPA: hypothetical protein VKB86_17450 [Pyrinomonadaceae bacterium]|nr:hypothetical protein [Pyrinomonadaceae bacterium]